MTIVARHICQECRRETREASTGLPIAILGLGGHRHAEACVGHLSNVIIQVYEGNLDDVPPTFLGKTIEGEG